MDASVYFTVICFSISKDSPDFLAMKHQMAVSSLSRRDCFRMNPYPAHYRPALASSILLCPHPHRLPLRVAFPDWPVIWDVRAERAIHMRTYCIASYRHFVPLIHDADLTRSNRIFLQVIAPLKQFFICLSQSTTIYYGCRAING